VELLLADPVQIFGRPTHHQRAEIWVYLVMCEASKYLYGVGEQRKSGVGLGGLTRLVTIY